VQPLLQSKNTNFHIYFTIPYLCVGVSSMQCACAILSCVASPALRYFFSTLSHTRHDYRKKNVTEREVYVLILSTHFV